MKVNRHPLTAPNLPLTPNPAVAVQHTSVTTISKDVPLTVSKLVVGMDDAKPIKVEADELEEGEITSSSALVAIEDDDAGVLETECAEISLHGN